MNMGYGDAMLTSNDSEMIAARDNLYAINNSKLYDAVDEMTDLTDKERDAVEDLAQSILEAVDAKTALNYANSNYSETLAKTLSQLEDIKTSTNEYASANEILTSDDYALKDRVKAYEQVAQALRGDEEAFKAFTDTYSQYEIFAKMGDDVLDFIEKVGLSIDDINDLYTAAEKLRKAGIDITDQDYQSRFDDLLQTLADSNGDIATAIETVFGDYLAQFQKGTEDYIDAYNAFINAYADLTAVGMLNMGQNLEALKNQVNNFYEKAAS
jgi:regulator of replication initiation timing